MAITTFIKRTGPFMAVVLLAGCSLTTNVETPAQQGQPNTEQLQPGHYHTAEIALERGDAEKAGNELKLALQADPLDPKAHFLLGSLLASQGVEDQAMVGFQRAIISDPTNPKAMHNLGTLLLHRDEAVPAAGLLEAAVIQNPAYLPPYNNLAKAYFQAGLPELAIATYKEVLQKDPVNTVASQNLALLLAAAESGGTNQKAETGDNKAKRPGSGDKKKESKAPPRQPTPGKDTGPEKQTPNPDAFRKLLRSLPYVTVEEQAGGLVLTGWTRGQREREILDRILTRWPRVLDLTGVDAGDPQRMLEVDAVLFILIGLDNQTVGFNFLRQIDLSYTYFNKGGSAGEWKGLKSPGSIDKLIDLPSAGSLLVAAVDYDVSIANAVEERVAVLARPHLTTLNGTPASFLAGGEWVFRVSGIENGNIKPYPFGTQLTVTPTLLRTPGEDGAPRVHLAIQAQRTSVLEILTAQASDDDIVFDKLRVDSQAVLDLGQTLILSGLNQKESRSSDTGVPLLKDIPLLKYLFSQKTTVETNTAVIILLTPRDPVFTGERNRRSLANFVEMRRAFVKARQGTEDDMLQFQQRYPDWRELPPNRFSSHFFLVNNSELYRSVSGEDLLDEDLDLPLLKALD